MHGEADSHLYRIAAEAVANAAKHADAHTITIRLTIDDGDLVLSVEDDGVGIPDAPIPTDGVGLRMMRYRADLIGAQLVIEPGEGGGTVVRCRLPLESTMSEVGISPTPD